VAYASILPGNVKRPRCDGCGYGNPWVQVLQILGGVREGKKDPLARRAGRAANTGEVRFAPVRSLHGITESAAAASTASRLEHHILRRTRQALYEAGQEVSRTRFLILDSLGRLYPI